MERRIPARLIAAVCSALLCLGASLPAAEATKEMLTRKEISSALDELQLLSAKASRRKLPNLYAQVPLMVGPKFLAKGWRNYSDVELREDHARFLMQQIAFERSMLRAALNGKPDPRVVPPVPDYATLAWNGDYLYGGERPVLLITTGNAQGNDVRSDSFGRGDLYGIISAVGASRYDFDETPIWELYQKDPKSHRVYDGDWCGHIIKDRWSMGGALDQKTECVISLDYPPMLEAVRQTILANTSQWKRDDHRRQRVLAMDWEFTYQNYDEPSRVKFQNWLRARYQTVDALNAVWKTGFTSFSEVPLPPVQSATDTNPARYYDHGEFNLWRFTRYLRWAKDVIHAEIPRLPIMVGGGNPFGRQFWKDAIDEEGLMLDGVADVWLSETGSRSAGSASLMDLQHSINPGMMIVDPEYHSTGGYMPLMFFHGCGSLDVWQPGEPLEKGNLPDAYAMLAGALNVRRLSDYIIQFPKAAPQAALLYSRPSLVQRHPGAAEAKGMHTPYTLELEKCYRAASVLDTPIGFITSRMVRQGQAQRLKVLVVPGAYFANEEEVRQIYQFARLGGTVVITPTSMVADEYNRKRDYLKQIGVEVVQEIVPRYLADKFQAGVEQAGSEYDFIQGPIAKTVVEDAPRATLAAGLPGFPAELQGEGIRQAIRLTGAVSVLARYGDGAPAIVNCPLGKGRLVYAAMQLSEASLADLLDWVYTQAGVERPIRFVDLKGGRVPGIECRTVACHGGQLTYVYNLTDRTLHGNLAGQPSGVMTNLLTCDPLVSDAGLELGPYEWVMVQCPSR